MIAALIIAILTNAGGTTTAYSVRPDTPRLREMRPDADTLHPNDVRDAARADTLHLSDLHEAARRYFPLQRQARLHEEIAELRIQNISARFLPQLSSSGQALYQSDVPELPIQMSGFSPPEVRKDQYKVALNIEQLIFDGGIAASQRDLERTSGVLAAEEVEVALHSYLERVDDAYFGALLQQAAAAILAFHLDDVVARRDAVRVQASEGILPVGQEDVLQVELLKIDQQIAEAQARRAAALNVLEELTGLDIQEDVVLAEPDVVEKERSLEERLDERGRPEYRVFDLQRDKLEHQIQLAGRKQRPSVSSFGTAAYGRPPGMNIFENELSPYYSVGLQMRWPFWDWRSSHREQRIAELQQEIVDAQENAFSQRIRTTAERVRQEIVRLEKAIASDREIIRLRERIAARAAEQMVEGTINPTEYVTEKEAERQARLTFERHRTELSYAQIRYIGILGRYDEIR